MPAPDIYDPVFVKDLFDEMSATYGLTNTISSFGFNRRWRRQCVELAGIRPGMTVCDLMSGMGECWSLIAGKLGREGTLVAADLSPEMCRKAEPAARRVPVEVRQLEEDLLRSSIPSDSADCVVSTFGLKTFSPAQMTQVAGQIARILKPGGSFSLLEISVPPATALRLPYMFYLRRVIPVIGRIFMGNPDNYRLLGVYTTAFGSCAAAGEKLREAGLEVSIERFFFGCATGLHGRKPPG